jgi:hypothetical protein
MKLDFETNPGQELILTHQLPKGTSSSHEVHGKRQIERESEHKKPFRQKGGGGLELLIDSQPEGRNKK